HDRVWCSFRGDVMPEIKFTVAKGVWKTGTVIPRIARVLQAKVSHAPFSDGHHTARSVSFAKVCPGDQRSSELGAIPLVRAVVVAPCAIERSEARCVASGRVLIAVENILPASCWRGIGRSGRFGVRRNTFRIQLLRGQHAL